MRGALRGNGWSVRASRPTARAPSPRMTTFLRTLEFLSVGLWLGSDVFLSFVVAPGAFHLLATRDQAGVMVGFALTRMHIGGIICGVIFLLTRLARTRSFASVAAPATLCVLVMIAGTLVSQLTVGAA